MLQWPIAGFIYHGLELGQIRPPEVVDNLCLLSMQTSLLPLRGIRLDSDDSSCCVVWRVLSTLGDQVCRPLVPIFSAEHVAKARDSPSHFVLTGSRGRSRTALDAKQVCKKLVEIVLAAVDSFGQSARGNVLPLSPQPRSIDVLFDLGFDILF
jgi:hypothetical protein